MTPIIGYMKEIVKAHSAFRRHARDAYRVCSYTGYRPSCIVKTLLDLGVQGRSISS